jgi:hypothetical protein
VDCRPHPGRREDAESVGRQCTMKRVQQGAGAPTQDSRARGDATNALGMAIDPRADAAGQILGRIIHGDHGTQGEFNWSSQHLDRGGVDGQANGVDEGAYWAVADEVAGGAIASAGGRARVLA